MEVEFGDLSWHDAELSEVRVDRREPGDCDTVVLLVRWPSGAIDEVCFFDSYGLDARMNFGVVAAETVLEGRVFENSPKLSKLQKNGKQSVSS